MRLLGQVKIDCDQEVSTVKERKSRRLARYMCKRLLLVDDTEPVVRVLRNALEAISAIAAGEGRNRSFRQKRLDGTLEWTIRINRG